MPLDGHSYLIAQGWGGKGTGLRHGAISRPLAIPQKKNLAGLGKDRDEAFPFWDHLFSAAAKSIQLKVGSDDEENESTDQSDAESSVPVLKRTATGIFSNRRPVTGAPASTSGTNTPDTGNPTSRPSLLAAAKREAAKTVLYARFFRGPVLGPDAEVVRSRATQVGVGEREEVKENSTKKRQKAHDTGDNDRREGKRRKKERKKKQEDLTVTSSRKAERSASVKEEKLLRKEKRRHEKASLKEGVATKT